MSAEIIVIGGTRYWIAPVVEGRHATFDECVGGKADEGVRAPAIPADASVKAAFRRAVSDKLATGENWNLHDIAQAKGCAVGTVRKHVGGILQEATPQKRKRGRTIRCTARSVARYLGEDYAR